MIFCIFLYIIIFLYIVLVCIFFIVMFLLCVHIRSLMQRATLILYQ